MNWIQILGLIASILLGVYNTLDAWQDKQEKDAHQATSAVVFGVMFGGARAKKEKGGGPSKTEQAGYIPPKIQIERMILAGERLVQARQEEFSPVGEDGEPVEDPTRAPGFDEADAFQLAQDVSGRLRAAQQTADAAKVVPEALDGPQEVVVPDVPETLTATERALLEQLRKSEGGR